MSSFDLVMEGFEILEFSINLDLLQFNRVFEFAKLNLFDVVGGPYQSIVGNITVASCFEETGCSRSLASLSQTIQISRKRSNNFPDVASKNPKVFASVKANSMVQKDVSKIFKDLNLVPKMTSPSDDLQCALCSYRATQKSHLKTHYKLKHLGGADLAMNCNICEKKCSTKSNLKTHLIRVHKLSREDASKLTV